VPKRSRDCGHNRTHAHKNQRPKSLFQEEIGTEEKKGILEGKKLRRDASPHTEKRSFFSSEKGTEQRHQGREN